MMKAPEEAIVRVQPISSAPGVSLPACGYDLSSHILLLNQYLAGGITPRVSLLFTVKLHILVANSNPYVISFKLNLAMY
jgi:hypothetical protein